MKPFLKSYRFICFCTIASWRENNLSLGGRPKTSEKKEKLVLRLRDEGESYRGIREQTGLGLATIRRIIADRDALLEQSEQVEALMK